MQTTSHILMIRPVNFAFNAETATNNAFQVKNDETNVQGKALKEFDELVSLLRKNGVDVTVVEDTLEPNTPDSIFPNNWISFHGDGTINRAFGISGVIDVEIANASRSIMPLE